MGTSASLYLSIFNALATLMCMYGFKLLSNLAQNIDGMEEVHAIVGKTRCMQLTMFVTGFEGMIFNALAQFGLFPCEPPLNFYSRRQVLFNYSVVLQAFFLGLMARFYYRRHTDIQRQAILRDDVVLDDNNGQTVFTAVDAYQHQSYEAIDKTHNLVPVTVSKHFPDDASSTSA